MLSIRVTTLHTLRLLLAAAIVLPGSLAAGEKIRFSSPDKDDAAPLADPKEKLRFSPTGGIENFRPTATDPAQIPFVLTSVPTPGTKNKGGRDEDPANERREWIFNNMKEVENRGGKKSTKKDSEERDLDSTEKKDKTAMEEFFDSRTDKQKNSGKDGKFAKDADNNPARDPNAPPGLGLEAADSRPPGMRNNGPGSSSRPRSDLSRAEGDSGKVSTDKSELRESLAGSRASGPRSERQMEREARAVEDFSRLLNSSSAPGAAPGGPGSSFNFSSGSPLQSASPLSQSSFDAMLGKRPASALPSSLPGSGGNLKPAALDDFGPKPAAAFSAPAPVFTPNTALLPPPRQSGILEVPKRRQ